MDAMLAVDIVVVAVFAGLLAMIAGELRAIRRTLVYRADGSGFKSDDASMLRYIATKLEEDVNRGMGVRLGGDAGTPLYYPVRMRSVADAILRLTGRAN